MRSFTLPRSVQPDSRRDCPTEAWKKEKGGEKIKGKRGTDRSQYSGTGALFSLVGRLKQS